METGEWECKHVYFIWELKRRGYGFGRQRYRTWRTDCLAPDMMEYRSV